MGHVGHGSLLGQMGHGSQNVIPCQLCACETVITVTVSK